MLTSGSSSSSSSRSDAGDECCLSTNVHLVCDDSVLTALVTDQLQSANQVTRYRLQVNFYSVSVKLLSKTPPYLHQHHLRVIRTSTTALT